MAKLPKFVSAGSDGLTAGNGKFVKLEAGKPFTGIINSTYEGILSLAKHSVWLDGGNSPHFVCFKESWCPGCIIGNKPRFQALMLCSDEKEPEKEQVLTMGIGLYKDLKTVDDIVAADTLKGAVVRITRTGKGKNDTKYGVQFTGRRVKGKYKKTTEVHEELLKHIGNSDVMKIIEDLEEANVWTKAHQQEFDKNYDVDIEDEEEDFEEDEPKEDIPEKESKPESKAEKKTETKAEEKPKAEDKVEDVKSDDEFQDVKE